MGIASLEYYADPATFPAKLPSVEEIESAQEIMSDQSARKVVGIGNHFVVKYGVAIELLEGETMLFLRQSTSVPVPRVYALFQCPKTKKNYIIMERINGRSLELEWKTMNQSSKQAVTSKLQSILIEMRQLESPGYYCSIGCRGLPDGIFWTSDPSNPFAGPFQTETDLNQAIIAKYLDSGLSQYKAEYYSRVFNAIFRNHKPVFSHGDIQRKNIMIGFEGNSTTEPTVVLIDWEYAGWYPSYWEYARAVFACGRWSDDWSNWIDRILEPWLSEYAWMNMLLRELWS